MGCKGVCTRYKTGKTMGGHYAQGHKRCQVCEVFLLPEGVNPNNTCKCCGYKVRTKPRNMTVKNSLREKMPDAF